MAEGGAEPSRSGAGGRHVAVLARMELRRVAAPMGRTVIAAAVGVPALSALAGEELAVAALVVLGIGVWMQGPLELLRDRLGGDLLFLATLPVPAATVAAGKLLAAAAAGLLAALLFTAAGVWAGPDVASTVSPLAAAVGIFVGSGIVTTTGALVACALVARLRFRVLTSGLIPLAGLLGLTGVLWLVDRLVPDPWARIAWLLARPWLPPVTILLSVLLAALISWAALRLTATGIRTYRPEPDAVSW